MNRWQRRQVLPALLCASAAATLGAATLGAVPAPAQAPDAIQVTVDRNQVTMGGQIYLTIRIEGAPEEPPTLPELPDFRVLSRGSQRSIQITNGRHSNSVSYAYLLIPLRAGTFEIGAATARVAGAEVRSRPFTVQVGAADNDGAERNRDLFVTASVSTDQPWQGQQVIYTWRFHHRVQIGQASIESLDFGSGVVAEDLGEVRQFSTVIDGVQYSVNEVRKALFPQRVGETVLPPTQLGVEVLVEDPRRQNRPRSLFDEVDSIFGRSGRWETRRLFTEPLTLNVRPLPPPPEGWNGLVGDFDITASLSRRELQVGQSATLEVKVAGTGNARLISEPAFPDLPAFKVYPDQPVGNVDHSGRLLAGRKVFKRALVPLVVGALEIPPLEIVHFDPERGDYVERATAPIDLEVTPADGEEELRLTESLAPTTGKVAVRILADDILPVRRTAAGIESAAPQGWRAWAWLAGGVAPPVLYLVLLARHRRERRYAADRTLRRRQRALRQALADARKLPSGGGAAAAGEASRVLRSYVGDKLGALGAALTPAEAESALVEAGVAAEAAARCRAELERFDAARYGAAAGSGPVPRALAGADAEGANDLVELIRTIDRQFRGKKR